MTNRVCLATVGGADRVSARDTTAASSAPSLPAAPLSPQEQQVYQALAQTELNIDEVIFKSGLPSSAVAVALLSLEMKCLIRQSPGRLYARNR